jgi:peptidoglycan/LPS O-acetylase OafA/YrhL
MSKTSSGIHIGRHVQRRSGRTDTAPIGVSKRFRPEIEGLRFVAAVLVASYHLWTGRVSGGVDVFFVVSGFLISTTLMNHLDRYGEVKPLTYLTRLAYRLLPAAATVLISVLVASRVLMPESTWVGIGREVRASALYSQNWFLAANSTDYLAQWQEKTPVEHFWALSVQGQFYVGWLVLFALIFRLARRWPTLAIPLSTVVLAVVFACSLAYSVWYTDVNQPVAYFSTFARAWEFALGGLAALWLQRRRKAPGPVRSSLLWLAGWVGFATVLSTGLVLHVSTVFPGYAALMPTGAALLILLSADSRRSRGIASLLGTRTMVWLGSLSYGIYLWHFPLMIIDRNVRDSGDTSLARGLTIIALAVALAWLTKVLVERPALWIAERGPRPRFAGFQSLTATMLATAIGASVFALPIDKQEVRQVEKLAATTTAHAYDLPACAGANARTPLGLRECSDRKVTKLIPAAGLITPTHHNLPCRRVVAEAEPMKVCLGGSTDPDPRATVMLVGDSHARAIQPALEVVAKHRGWRLLTTWSPGCQTAAAPKVGSTHQRCARWMEEVTRFVQGRSQKIDLLVTIGSAHRDLVGSPDRDKVSWIETSFREQWQRYDGLFIQQLVIRDTPKFSPTLISCLGRHSPGTAGAGCSLRRSTAVRSDYAALAAQTDGNALTRVVDLSDVFCTATRCSPVVGGYVAYSDPVHLHSLFAPTLGPLLDQRIHDAIRPAARTLLYGD